MNVKRNAEFWKASDYNPYPLQEMRPPFLSHQQAEMRRMRLSARKDKAGSLEKKDMDQERQAQREGHAYEAEDRLARPRKRVIII